MPSRTRLTRTAAGIGLATALALLSAGAARADDHGSRAPLLPRYSQECGSCHVPYAPRLLPAASWQRLMAGLPRHFGTDASLDAATVAELSRWLQAEAASGRRAGDAPPPEDRITRSTWFQREHRGVAAEVWRRPSVRSAAQCAACHADADRGRFSERDVRIPK